jgi:hypothetical protein
MAGRRSEFDISKLVGRVRQIPGLIDRELKPLVYQEARLFVREVVSWTPPASQGKTGLKAKKQGEAAVERDIRRVYGTLADGYETIREIDPAAAAAYWFLVKEGNYIAAGDILRTFGARQFGSTRSFAKFDGGAMHKRFRNRRGRIARNRVMMIVTDQAALTAYIRKMQGRVGLLASGWASAAAKLGVRLPAWVTRHGTANGGVAVEIGAGKLVIVISNKVKYGAAQDLQRRADYVMRYRQAALRRRLPYVLRAALKKSGLGGGKIRVAA